MTSLANALPLTSRAELDARLPLLITGITGVAGYNAFHYLQKRYPAKVIGVRRGAPGGSGEKASLHWISKMWQRSAHCFRRIASGPSSIASAIAL